MNQSVTIIGGLVIPSTSPVFLAGVLVHASVALTAVLAGLIAILSPKGPGRHRHSGTVYFWSLSGVFISATALTLARWVEDYHLFLLGATSFTAAFIARAAVRARRSQWARLHAAGMSLSYLFLLIAFYVDNGKNLPLWRNLPTYTYWLIPAAVAIPIMLRAFLRNPLLRTNG